MKEIFYALVTLLLASASQGQVINADPSNYTGFLGSLQPGDTLLLAPGTYVDRLNVFFIEGTADLPIVIMGSGPSTVFEGDACCNTVSIRESAHVVIRDFLIDGLDIPFIDAVKAEGTDGNWTHHMTIENLDIINHNGAALSVGINTKCTSWDWIIRGNRIIEPGLGMYLGNSDGSAPFVNGIIEHNLVVDPMRYGIQIKHQNEGTRDVPGMTLNGKTIIRHNVISKENNADADSPRPNLLVGNFPASGDGEHDYYEIYGNFLWQNPVEGLFQGTGNIAFYNNLLVNDQPGGWCFISFPHNNFPPRNIDVFNNTVIGQNEGIEINNPSADFEQLVAGNAIFSGVPLDLEAGVDSQDNLTADYNNANDYVVDATGIIGDLDLTPLATMQLSEIDHSSFDLFEDSHLDFDSNAKGWDFRGAYASIGSPDWVLAIDQIPFPLQVNQPTQALEVILFPNPFTDFVTIKGILPGEHKIDVYSANGEHVYQRRLNGLRTLDLSELGSGLYLITLSVNGQRYNQRIIKW